MAREGEKLLRPPTEAGPLFALHYVRLGTVLPELTDQDLEKIGKPRR